MDTRMDRVYYWSGGTASGHWNTAIPEQGKADAMVADIRRMGYFAVPGKASIGAPEGVPDGLVEFQSAMVFPR